MRNLIFLSLLAFAAPSHAENPAPAAGYWEGIATLKTTFLEFKKTITKTRKFYGISRDGGFNLVELDAPLHSGMFNVSELGDNDTGLSLAIIENMESSNGGEFVITYKTNKSGEMVSCKTVEQWEFDDGGTVIQVLTIQATFKKGFPQ